MKRREIIPEKQCSAVLEQLSKKIPAEVEFDALNLDREVTEYSGQETDSETHMEDNPVHEEYSDSNSHTNIPVKLYNKTMKEKKAPEPVNELEKDSDSSVYSDLEENDDSDSGSSEKSDEMLLFVKPTEKSKTSKVADEAGQDSDSSVYSDEDDESEISESEDEVIKSQSQKEKKQNGISEVPKENEYEHDTSDEEDIRNTVGNIPMKWYDDFPHIGYDIDGKKIMKPATSDAIDEFLSKMDDPNYWRTVKNKMTGEKVVLTDEDLDIIQRIQSGKYPTSAVQYETFEDFFTYEEMEHPVTNHPPHKRSFIPSKIEKEKVSKLVYAIKMGWIKPRAPKEQKDPFYMLWEKDVADESKRLQHYIPAPKRKLPGHEESYNPPPEFVFTKEEEEKWKEQESYERKIDFIPKKYPTLRQTPAYSNYIKEWFERCLDLYLCPRKRKMRVNVDPNDLLPQLPKPKDLQPFPSALAIIYTGHEKLVRSISVEPSGQFLASGSDDETVRIWEILTGRCMRSINLGGPIKQVAWCPLEAMSLILVSVGEKVYVINTKLGDKVVVSNTDSVLSSFTENHDEKAVTWSLPSDEQKAMGVRLIITHTNEVKQIAWHAKGDYFATVVPNSGFRSIVIHQLSKFRSQVPFQKLKGNVQSVLFHPLRPFFFVATQKHIKMYNLMKQEISKVLFGNCKWISSMAAHPQGDNIIVGSYDSRLSWFDLELSTKPYKTLRHHSKAIRQVGFHKRYPLFASTSDDGSVIICHGMVYSDLLQNPSIIPVKILKGHGMSLDCCFHPQRPWVFCSSNNTIRLYS
ncbi:Ribosome biogenesis protein bop1 [Araneus ventricosus]|uniref:Ribosome biogenesis protein BOP1 homolog n=1 Tax=Araneus ventricosus TaxID=182803 RepID=A0A4Y2I8H7_ARAVE|nr:Ribosome biogenesis protein bop1 [Araneus ventricosus]